MKIAVVGSGAIGLYYGGKLAHAGRDVHFLMRGDLGPIRRDGLSIRGDGENFRVTKVNCHNSTKEIGPSDLVLIAVKANSNNEIVDLIPPLLHERTMLMTMQNGLGNEEFFAGHFGAERVLGGLCIICLNRTSRNEIERVDYGRVTIGEYGRAPLSRTHQVANEFTASGIECKVTEDLALERWGKLVWNIPFNGLSILAGGANTEQILTDEHLRELTLAVMQEVIEAANKCGHALPPSAIDKNIKRTESMKPYKPSTLVDFESGKPLEIEAIWGEPLRRAAAAGAKTPRLEMLHSLLNVMDRQRKI
jgi:2-dehydropantoate 2-reductase